jgi:very-short-patch-repair endonuclease
MSPPERLLWDRLRAGRLDGHKFRRQHPLGPYAADFYCHAAGLVVEVDGLNHLFNLEEDARRDAWMRERGLRVLRLSAKRVLVDVEEAVELIRDVLREVKAPSPGLAEPRPPSPAQAGEGLGADRTSSRASSTTPSPGASHHSRRSMNPIQ